MQIAEQAHLESVNQLYEEVGLGNRPAAILVNQIIKTLGEAPAHDEHQMHVQPILIRGTEGLLIHFAECCHPIPGDAIIGRIRVGHGIEVHTQHCKTMQHTSIEANQLVPLEWEPNVKGDFSVGLKLDMLNKRGSLAALTLAIAENDANIETIRAQESDTQQFHVEITIAVRNRAHLARVLRKLRQRQDVVKVVRTRAKSAYKKQAR